MRLGAVLGLKSKFKFLDDGRIIDKKTGKVVGHGDPGLVYPGKRKGIIDGVSLHPHPKGRKLDPPRWIDNPPSWPTRPKPIPRSKPRAKGRKLDTPRWIDHPPSWPTRPKPIPRSKPRDNTPTDWLGDFYRQNNIGGAGGRLDKRARDYWSQEAKSRSIEDVKNIIRGTAQAQGTWRRQVPSIASSTARALLNI